MKSCDRKRGIPPLILISAPDIDTISYIFLSAIELTPGGSSTVHIYTQTVHRTTQWNRIHRNHPDSIWWRMQIAMTPIPYESWFNYLRKFWGGLRKAAKHLIPQSFDCLAAFHLDLLQAVLFIAAQYNCQLLCFWQLALYCSRGLPTAFSRIVLLQGCLLQTR
jgi:hypothetical protein